MRDLILMLKEIWRYAWQRKQWVIALFIIFTLLLGVLVALSGATYLAPFIYPFI